MEKYAKRVLFILTVNHIGKISSAIKSRCKVYYFKRLSPKDGAEHLKLLTESCGAPIEWEQDYEYLVEHTNGDLRDAINHLEAISPYRKETHRHIH
jgi:DNA polymerase III delta prime subunit